MIISNDVQSRIESLGVELFYLPREATKWFNAKRRDPKKEIALLGGWYWTLGREECGPFKSQSAAARDVFYRKVLKHLPPMMTAADLKASERDAVIAARKNNKRHLRLVRAA